MKKIIFFSLLMVLVAAASCSKEEISPIEDYQMEEPQPDPDDKPDEDWDCEGCASGAVGCCWAQPEFSVEGGEVFRNEPGFVSAGIGAEGGIITLTHVGGVGWLDFSVGFNERGLVSQHRMELAIEHWYQVNWAGVQNPPPFPIERYENALVVTFEPECERWLSCPPLRKIESEYFTIIINRYSDEIQKEFVIEMFPNTTGEENELDIFLFAGNTSGSIRITQAAE